MIQQTQESIKMKPLRNNPLHPVFIPGAYILQTPMMNDLANTVNGWLANGFTGGIVLGESRVGKSVAIEYLKSSLTNRANEMLPVVTMTVAKRDVRTVASIYRNICFSIGKKAKTRMIADIMANDLIHYFSELSLTNQTRQVILVVDEMQRLSLHQFEAFAELYDELQKVGTNLMVVFVGNESDSSPTVKRIDNQKYALVSGRFFNHRLKFSGIINANQIRSILKQYDQNIITDFGNISTTEYFLTKQFNSGWRFEHLSKQIWCVYKKNFKTRYKLESWPMQYFSIATRILLTDYLPKFGTDNAKAIQDMILKSIEASQLVFDKNRFKS
jgi:Cdc6-like AAA superfamily ATPase